jgi:hypothetical protein
MTEAETRPHKCYCRPGDHTEHRRNRGIPAGYCGRCQVCAVPGHTCHFPGPLPYTGSWCDAHYALLYDRMAAAENSSQPYGIRDVDRAYFCSHGRRRWLFWRGDSFLMEFRSQWLTRYVAITSQGTARRPQRRWDHPLSAWLLPLELMRSPDWRAVSPEEFERTWATVARDR